jgi:uncharacterized coiled-coil protein SlyX
MEPLDTLPARVAGLEHNLSVLTATVDRRFDEVSVAFVEQREYVEFTYARLDDKMTRRFDGVERRLDAVETRLDAVERRLDAVERRLDALEKRFDVFEKKLDLVVAALAQPRQRPPRRKKR